MGGTLKRSKPMRRDTTELVLASTSSYRRALLRRLGLAFRVQAPGVAEQPLPAESPLALVRRLSRKKANAVAAGCASALVIGSDQVAVLGSRSLGKPGCFERNVAQLTALAGKEVRFLTGLCVLNSVTGDEQVDVIAFDVKFRDLSRVQIESYVALEQPFDCAGGFKSEGLGVALFEWMRGDDPSALIGLPLIRLVEMLRNEGRDVLTD